MTGLEVWLLGYTGTKITDKILELFRGNQLINDLHSEIDVWVDELPSDASLASSYAMFPSQKHDYDLKERDGLVLIRTKLQQSTLPEKEDWKNALIEQWRFVRSTVPEAQDFFQLEDSVALEHIKCLSERLDSICSKHAHLFNPAVIKLLREIADSKNIDIANFKDVAENIMCDIRYRNFTQAKEKLKLLNEIEPLESSVKSLLLALSIKVELAEGIIPNKKKLLVDLKNSSHIPGDIIDLVMSILIDLESRNQKKIAYQRYDDIEQKTPYIEEVFFELIANKAAIINKFNSSLKYDFTEQELTGLTRGAFREEDYELAVNIAHFLKDSYPSFNAEALLLYYESCLLVTSNQTNHYFLLDRKLKERADLLIHQVVSNIKSGDIRYVLTLINFLSLTSFSERMLVELAKEYIDEIVKFKSECADILHQISTAQPVNIDHFELSTGEIDYEDYAKLHRAIEENKLSPFAVNRWIDNGGEIQTGDEFIDSFLKLFLHVRMCCKDSSRNIADVKKYVESFLKSDIEKCKELHPLAVKELSEDLVQLDLPLYAIEFLTTILPDSPWLSPIFICYLNALLAAEKYECLKEHLDGLDFNDKSSSVWMIEAQLYEKIKVYNKAVSATRNAISLNKDNAYSWYFLLHSMRLMGESVEVLKQVIYNDILDSVFESFCESKLPLIHEIAVQIDINLAEQILVDWFVRDPDLLAKHLTNIHFESIRNRPAITSNPYVPHYCCDGVVYSDGFSTRRKILVKNINSKHSSLLDINSPLGKILDNMKVGEQTQYGLGRVKLIERLSPYVAAFQLAIKLRDAQNDGSDAFWSFSLPSNKEDLIPSLENVLKNLPSNNRAQNKALQNPNMPLVMRGHYTSPNDPVQGALHHLTAKDSTRYISLFNKGVEKPSRVVIDVYTIVYMSRMGLASALSNSSIKLVLSEESKSHLEHWVEDIQREDYLTLDYTEKGIVRHTAEDIKRDSYFFIKELKALLSVAEVEVLILSDIPDNVVQIRDVMDATVYSTFKLSIANDLPWLCIDHIMCQLSHDSGYQVVNINAVIIELLHGSSYENRLHGIRHNLLVGIPIPILYRDIVELSRSPDNVDVYLVYRFIEKYCFSGELFHSPEVTINFLTDIVGRITANAYSDGKVYQRGKTYTAAYDGYVEHVFNYCSRAAIRVLEGNSAEGKFAVFISNIYNIYGRRIRSYMALLNNLASLFATGHFLDIDEINRGINSLQDCEK